MKNNILIALLLSCTAALSAHESTSTIIYKLTLECPPSEERDAVEQSIPHPDFKVKDLEEWMSTTVNELKHLITLVESGNFANPNVEFGSEYLVTTEEETVEAAE